MLPMPALSYHFTETPDSAPTIPVTINSIPAIDDRYDAAKALIEEQLANLFDEATDTLEPIMDLVPDQPIVLYVDGTPDNYQNPDPALSDGRRGQLGLWGTAGTDGWRPDASAAAPNADPTVQNDWGHYFGSNTGYAAQTASVLVTPELDLRTGYLFDDDTVEPYSDQVFDNFFNDYAYVGDAGSFIRDPLYVLEYQARYNLGPIGAQADRVLVRVLENPPETYTDLTVCGSGCRPVTTFYGEDVWKSHTIDLNPWAEQKVWVVFVADTGVQDTNHFANPAFNQSAGYYGFQLDDLVLKAPGAPMNVQVHEIVTPQSDDTLEATEEIVVRGFVRNTGIEAIRVDTFVTLKAGALEDKHSLATRTLAPGEVQRIAETFNALNSKQENVEAMIGFTLPDGDNRAIDAFNHDNEASVVFDVESKRYLHIHDPVVSPRWVALNEAFNVTATIHNHGTVFDSTTIHARLVDLADPSLDVQALIDHPSQGIALQKGEAVELKWNLDTSQRAQYRLFLRTDDMPVFTPDLLDPDGRQRFESPFVSTPPTVDGALTDAAWASAQEYSVTYGGEDGELPQNAFLKFVNTETDVYISVRLPNRSDDKTDPNNDDEIIEFLFDDGADLVLLQDEDGYRINGDSNGNLAGGLRLQDLAFDATDLDWEVQSTLTGEAARQFYPPQPPANQEVGEYRVELRRPLEQSNLLDGFAAKAGDPYAFASRLVEITQPDSQQPPVTRAHRFPASALLLDGQGPLPMDGKLGDEAGTWQMVQTTAKVTPTGSNFLSGGFGIGTGPPLVWSYDVARDGCPDVSEWQFHSGWPVLYPEISDSVPVGFDRWNCGFFGPEGRTMLYEGMAPGSMCGLNPCPPYSARDATFRIPQNEPFNLRDSTLTTKPILIQADDPFLLIRHQYATAVEMLDRDDQSDLTERSQLAVASIAYVTATTINPQTGNPDEVYYLVPTDGYDTEISTGIRDPRHVNGRDFLEFYDSGLRFPLYCNEGPSRAGLTIPAGWRQPENCGWWHPTGFQDRYKPLDDSFPLGAPFQGSPWTVDRIDLVAQHPLNVDGVGNQYGPLQNVDLRGELVQFTFHFLQQAEGTDPHPLDVTKEHPITYGWRIDTLAVTEGDRAVRDLAVLQTELATPYDARTIGVGPDSWVPVRVEVANIGLLNLDAATIALQCVDVNAAPNADGVLPLLPSTSFDLEDGLQPGQTQEVIVECKAPAEGGRMRIQAIGIVPGGDDLYVNDQVPLPGFLDVRASPDVAVAATITPQQGSADFIRAASIFLENVGNVPVTDFDVAVAFSRSGIADNEMDWHVAGTLPVGERLRITDSVLAMSPPVSLTSLFYDPPSTGEYSMTARILGLPEDITLENNLAIVPFWAVDIVYGNDFDVTPKVDLPGLVSGNAKTDGGIWFVSDEGKSNALRVGDSEGIIPPNSDGSFLLPPFDLTAASQATLSLVHKYEFSDEGFDGGRVEITTDGGSSWVPLRARPSEGLANGYPDATMVGSSALLDGRAEWASSAYTGSSSTLDEADSEGWIRSEFDLASVESLQKSTLFAEFPLGGLSPQPSGSFLDDGNRFFFHPDWSASSSPDDGWLIDNLAYNEPQPHTGQRMWWSGSVGHFDDQRNEFVNTALSFPVDLSTERIGTEEVYLSFWDWRAGWKDHERILERDGTGGRFLVIVETEAGQRIDVTASSKLVAREDNGWSKREIGLRSFLGQEITVEFRYISDSGDLGTVAQKNNEGWFLDDIAVTSYLMQGGIRSADVLRFGTDNLEGLNFRLCDRPVFGMGVYTVERFDTNAQGQNKESVACWSMVNRGAQRDTGWHLETVQGPGGEPTSSWNIRSDNEQGYPHQLNTRLVTPVVDLRNVVGQEARLEFDHKYEFESTTSGPIEIGIDAGVVEVQVFDPITATFGPWMQIAEEEFQRSVVRRSNALAPNSILDDRRDATGYPTYLLRGNVLADSVGTIVENGYGYPFDSFEGICQGCPTRRDQDYGAYPLGYAFSGNSQGWVTEDFNITSLLGEKVRFGFHAWSNPTYETSGALAGWDVAGVRVRGTVFEGAPVEIRLRAATDGSRLEGSWAIDELELSAAVHQRNVAVTSLDDRLLYPEGPITRTLQVANIGTLPRDRLAISVRAINALTETPIDVNIPGITEIPDSSLATKQTGESVVGPLFLTEVGALGSKRSFDVHIPNPPVDTPIRIEVRILEDRGETKLEGGQLNYYPRFTIPNDIVIPNTRGAWTVHALNKADLQWGLGPSGLPLTVEGAGPISDGAITASGTLRNNGSALAQFHLDWALTSLGSTNVLRSGSTGPHQVAPGEVAQFEWSPNAAVAPGLYTMTVKADGFVPVANLDFPVGYSEMAWVEGFNGVESPLPAGWTRSAEQVDTAFSMDTADGFLSWGTHPFSGRGYCGNGQDSNDPGSRADNLPCSQGAGYESWVRSPPQDLARSLNGRMGLDIEHAFSFVDGDGGHVDAAIVNVDANGNWVPRTCNGSTANSWTQLQSSSGSPYDGLTRSLQIQNLQWQNPLGGGVPSYRGPQGSLSQPVQTSFDLASQIWCPLGPESQPFAGEKVVLQFHVGIQDINKVTRPGWQIDEIALGSGGVELGPSVDGMRTLPLVRNAPKTIAYTISNSGAAEDTYNLRLASVGLLNVDGVNPDVRLLQDSIKLGGGESGLIWLTVNTKESMPAGQHEFRIIAESQGTLAEQANTFLATQLIVRQLPKADLSVQLSPSDDDVYEQGSVIPIHVRVSNIGAEPSKRTTVVVSALFKEDQTLVPIETLELPPVCAPRECGAVASRAVISAEWPVPTRTGTYTLVAEVDPGRNLLDLNPGNNRDELDVEVVPLQLPDLEVTKIEVIGADGRFIEAGGIATVRATVTNIGEVPAQGATVRLLANTVSLTEAALPTLAKGASYTVEASKVVPNTQGSINFRATVIGGSAPELRVDNNDAILSLSVRTHNVATTLPDLVAAASGGTTIIPVRIDNHGSSLERLKLSAKGPAGWSVQTLTPDILVTPDGGLTALVLVKVPADAVAGQHLVQIQLSTEKRLLSTVPAIVQVAADLQPAGIQAKFTDMIAGDQEVDLMLQSNSNVHQSVRVSDLLGWLIPSEFDLDAKSTLTIPTTLHIPSNTPPGNITNTIQVAAVDGTWTAQFAREVRILPTLALMGGWTEYRSLPTPGNGTRGMELVITVASRSNLPIDVTGQFLHVEGTQATNPAPFHLEPLEEKVLRIPVFLDERLPTPKGDLVFLLANGNLTAEKRFELPDLTVQPDLIIGAVSAQPASEGRDIILRAIVRNDGSADAAASMVHFYADGVLIQLAQVPAIRPGEEIGVEVVWKDASSGPHLILAIADGAGRLMELHEDNNGASTTLQIDEQTLVSSLFRGVPLPGWLILAPLLAAVALRRRQQS